MTLERVHGWEATDRCLRGSSSASTNNSIDMVYEGKRARAKSRQRALRKVDIQNAGRRPFTRLKVITELSDAPEKDIFPKAIWWFYCGALEISCPFCTPLTEKTQTCALARKRWKIQFFFARMPIVEKFYEKFSLQGFRKWTESAFSWRTHPLKVPLVFYETISQIALCRKKLKILFL